MVMNVTDAVSAYKNSGGLLDQSFGTSSGVGSGESFADTLSSFAGDAIGTLHKGESAAIASATGQKSDMAGVVTAVNNAEVVLDEVVALRDKVIAAYQAITSGAI